MGFRPHQRFPSPGTCFDPIPDKSRSWLPRGEFSSSALPCRNVHQGACAVSLVKQSVDPLSSQGFPAAPGTFHATGSWTTAHFNSYRTDVEIRIYCWIPSLCFPQDATAAYVLHVPLSGLYCTCGKKNFGMHDRHQWQTGNQSGLKVVAVQLCSNRSYIALDH